MSERKSLLVRFFDNPIDQAIQDWLDDVPKFQYGGQGMAIKTVLFEHAQKMGYRPPKKVPVQTEEREALDANPKADEKVNIGPSVQEKTDGHPSEHEYLTKLWPNIFNGVKYSGNL